MIDDFGNMIAIAAAAGVQQNDTVYDTVLSENITMQTQLHAMLIIAGVVHIDEGLRTGDVIAKAREFIDKNNHLLDASND